MKKPLFLTAALLLIPSLAFAAVANDNVYVSPDEVIDDNFIRAGSTITIDGTINGDVVAVGNTVTVNGTVAGDVLALAATITINGNVGGNLRAAAGTLNINGSVAKNVTVASGTLSTDKDATTGWSFAAAAGTLQMNGEVKGNVTIYGGTVTLANATGADATVYVDPDGTLSVLPTAVIGGDLTYTSASAADIQAGATIVGQTIHKLPTQTVSKAQKFLDASWIFGNLISLIAVLFVGVIIVSLFPGWVIETTFRMRGSAALAFLYGVIGLIVVPVVALILLFSLIGIPLALILMALYLIILYCGKVFVGTLIGVSVIKLLRGQKAAPKDPPLFWSMMLGTTIFALVAAIPFVGSAIGFIAVIWAFGALLMGIRQKIAARA